MNPLRMALPVRISASRRKVWRQRRLAVEVLETRMCLSLDVPAFSSLPGANHTIFLDFDGHVTSGTTWNTGYYDEDPINSPAWSLDADRLNFTDAERSSIGNIWRRVAEDFSPFNVNVTTVEPPISDLRRGEVSGDTKWGVRAVVTIETTAIRCGCGGIAYIGSFNDLYDEPVFVYNNSENGVAEAISHEVGHSLYLAHDGLVGADGVARTTDDVEYYGGHGSGNTSWAPIMGNSYNRNVTTWDLGEYYNSNNGGSNSNYGYGPDDLSIITSQNGFGFRPDDHGGTTATATSLSVAGTAVSGSGIIGSRTDRDVFSFTTASGTVTLGINPVAVRPNLDIQAELLDGAGNVVKLSNPAEALNAAFSLTLNAGTYYLRIDGVGYGTPASSTPTGYTDYGSIGQFSISGSVVDPGGLPTLSIDDVTVSEDGGNANFVVRLNGTITEDVTVTYGALNGSAQSGTDFTSVDPAILTFTPTGPATQTVIVPLVNDGTSEANETFNLVLSDASTNALITDATGVASITNDDAEWRINDVLVTEGNVSKKGVISYTTATFTVSLTHTVNRSVSVSRSTGATDDTATAGVDYQQSSGTTTISAGQMSASIAVTVIGDNSQESNETFSVLLSTVEGTVIDGNGIGTIQDNDSGHGNGYGKGGGPRNGPAAANYSGDFTEIGHTDLPEPALLHRDGFHDHSAHDHGTHLLGSQDHSTHSHNHQQSWNHFRVRAEERLDTESRRLKSVEEMTGVISTSPFWSDLTARRANGQTAHHVRRVARSEHSDLSIPSSRPSILVGHVAIHRRPERFESKTGHQTPLDIKSTPRQAELMAAADEIFENSDHWLT